MEQPAIDIHSFQGTFQTFPSKEGQLSIADYLVVAFSEAEEIDVLVGYFRVSFFQALAPLVALLYESKKKVRIVCGHQLSTEEEELIFGADKRPSERTENLDHIVSRIWANQFELSKSNELKNDVLLLIEEMMASGQLAIKPVVVRSDATSTGLFHQKEYFFSTSEWVSKAIGSANMTASMLSQNSESLEVRLEQNESLSDNMKSRIEFARDLWNDNEPNHFRAARQEIIRKQVERHNSVEGDVDRPPTRKVAARILDRVKEQVTKQGLERLVEQAGDLLQVDRRSGIDLRPHQREALDRWSDLEHVGLFEMATGAGKTITAIQGILELEQQKEQAFPVFILVPGKALVDQWYEEVRKFLPHKPVISITGQHKDREWRKISEIRLDRCAEGHHEDAPVVIGIYGTLLKQIKQWKADSVGRVTALRQSLLIADECHSMGAPEVKKTFQKDLFQFRIGLSATPDRYMDEEGTVFVREAFQAVEESAYVYGLSEAIRDGWLVPYYYEPNMFHLDEETQQEYAELTERISRLHDSDENSKTSELKKKLLIARVRLVMKSPAKKEAFRRWLKSRVEANDPQVKSMIVYAPEGFGDGPEDQRVIEDYQDILIECGLRSATFVGDSSSRYKGVDSPLEVFQRGRIDVLIAMKCLDEGVDLPRAECGVFLSSTGNTRQYIQRRGRLIRLYKEKSSARVVDFICLPKEELFGGDESNAAVEKSILKRELFRAAHFSTDAINQNGAEEVIYDHLNEINYCHLWDEVLAKN